MFISEHNDQVHLVHGNRHHTICLVTFWHIIIAPCNFKEDSLVRHRSGLESKWVGYNSNTDG